MRTEIKKSIALAGLICTMLLLSSCLEWDRGDITYTSGDSHAITITVVNASSDSVTLSITSDFNCDDVPIYRNGVRCGYVNLYYGSTTEFTDRDVVRGEKYFYQAGGLFFLLGEIWSNLISVIIP